MLRQGLLAAGLGLVIGTAGCVNFPEELMLGSSGDPFILKGTAAVVDNEGPCPVWVGDNGVTYHLFQGARVENDAFDQAMTPGVTSRLQIAVRTDIPVSCQIGTVVEVHDVLEIEGDG